MFLLTDGILLKTLLLHLLCEIYCHASSAIAKASRAPSYAMVIASQWIIWHLLRICSVLKFSNWQRWSLSGAWNWMYCLTSRKLCGSNFNRNNFNDYTLRWWTLWQFGLRLLKTVFVVPQWISKRPIIVFLLLNFFLKC